MNRETLLCVGDRQVWKSYAPGLLAAYLSRTTSSNNCPKCSKPGLNMGTRWRAPKKQNEAGWKRIEAGDYMWDKKAGKSRHVSPWLPPYGGKPNLSPSDPYLEEARLRKNPKDGVSLIEVKFDRPTRGW